MENKSSLHNNKALIVVAVCFLFFVIVGILVNHNSRKSSAKDHIGPLLSPSNNVMVLGRMRSYYSFYHQHTLNSINYVSKKRVPTGPNPFHNKRNYLQIVTKKKKLMMRKTLGENFRKL
ncbi:unnamed protein product [Cuscuta europaea]|uniref:Uncharacterized protein n=1 Tax=Cuscuta europaea TaxID=41803 RepID=A0A9P0ZV81_CUSEU|nr:unnamed protein product [Cuscuta europaea]